MLSSVMNLKKLCLTAVAGTLFVVVIWLTFDAWRYLARSPLPSTVAVAKPLIGFQTDPSWVRSGSPNFHNVELVRSSDGNTISGLWSCEGPSTFEWTYYMDETIYLLEGLIEIEYLGQRFTVLPGQVVTFHAGTKALWHVPNRVKKAYTLIQPPRAVRLWRRWLPMAINPDNTAVRWQ